MHTDAHIDIQYTQTNARAPANTHTHIYTNTHKNTHARTLTHTHTHKYNCIGIHTYARMGDMHINTLEVESSDYEHIQNYRHTYTHTHPHTQIMLQCTLSVLAFFLYPDIDI